MKSIIRGSDDFDSEYAIHEDIDANVAAATLPTEPC